MSGEANRSRDDAIKKIVCLLTDLQRRAHHGMRAIQKDRGWTGRRGKHSAFVVVSQEGDWARQGNKAKHGLI